MTSETVIQPARDRLSPSWERSLECIHWDEITSAFTSFFKSCKSQAFIVGKSQIVSKLIWTEIVKKRKWLLVTIFSQIPIMDIKTEKTLSLWIHSRIYLRRANHLNFCLSTKSSVKEAFMLANTSAVPCQIQQSSYVYVQKMA